MKLEQQVASLEISMRLKKLGVKQESLFVWKIPTKYGTSSLEEGENRITFKSPDEAYLANKYGTCEPLHWEEKYYYAAFTVAELGEMLKDGLMGGHFRSAGNRWTCEYEPIHPQGLSKTHIEIANTEADARGKMLIYLIENNLLSVKE